MAQTKGFNSLHKQAIINHLTLTSMQYTRANDQQARIKNGKFENLYLIQN